MVNRKDAVALHLALKKAYGETAPYNPQMKCLRCGVCCELEPPIIFHPEYGKPCRYLTRDRNGLASCQLYNSKERPPACKVYGWIGFKECPVGQVYWENLKI